jgi:uncharacterized protein YkwD
MLKTLPVFRGPSIICILIIDFIPMIHQLVRLSFLFVGFLPCPAGRPGSFLPSDSGRVYRLSDSMESEILSYVNEDREQHGLASLKMNTDESAIAARHSRDMATGKVPFGHAGLDARAKAIRKALGQLSSVGENVASGPMSAREVVDGWLNSPGHKRNIEGDFTLTGIGYARDKKGNIFFTQIFSR